MKKIEGGNSVNNHIASYTKLKSKLPKYILFELLAIGIVL